MDFDDYFAYLVGQAWCYIDLPEWLLFIAFKFDKLYDSISYSTWTIACSFLKFHTLHWVPTVKGHARE